MTDLFDAFHLGRLALPNRIVMAPMTRTRASEDGVPTDLMREYYVQRASAGLLVTECTQVSDQGHGIIRAPGLHRADQVGGWRRVVDAVRAAGGRIFCQLYHCGHGGAGRRRKQDVMSSTRVPWSIEVEVPFTQSRRGPACRTSEGGGS